VILRRGIDPMHVRTQDLRDQVGLLLGRVDSLARLLQGADHDGGGQAVLSKRLKSLRRRTPTSQPALVRIDACDGIKSSGSCRDSAGPAASRASDGHPPSWQDEWQNKVCEDESCVKGLYLFCVILASACPSGMRCLLCFV
jgi:hypothetical protein